MPTFQNQLILPCSPAEAFDFLRVPANRLRLAPPDAPLELIEGPALLESGSRTTWKLRRFGVSQMVKLEVTACEPPTRLVEEQREGPLRRWVQTVTVTPAEQGAAVHDRIDFEPPGGMLGFLVTAAKIDEMLAITFAWRDQKLREQFNSASRGSSSH
jgi:ligand-binding SRPBCC domain-containing protein